MRPSDVDGGASAAATADEPAALDLAGGGADVFRRGAFGENVLHLVLLRRGTTAEGKAIARHLVAVFGTLLVNVPLQERTHPDAAPGTYEGETALHMCATGRRRARPRTACSPSAARLTAASLATARNSALVIDDMEMTRFLVDSGADVRARAWGGFFKMTGNAFFGARARPPAPPRASGCNGAAPPC